MPITEWNGKLLVDLIEKDVNTKLNAIGALMERDVKQKLSIPGPTATNPGTAASAPGEPPHRRTGELGRSIAHEVDGNTVRVGTRLKKGFWLEVGAAAHTVSPGSKGFLAWKNASGQSVFTRKSVRIPALRARPYLRPTLDESTRAINTILGRPVR